MPIGGGKFHSFDLATPERDIIAECKAFTFTVTGNIPAAKITTLREAVAFLRALPGVVVRILIVKQDAHPRSGETLGHYFVRLNKHLLGEVIIFELSEKRGNLTPLHGDLK